MVCCLCCVVIVRVGLNVFECVSMRDVLCDVVWFVCFVCVCVMCVCVLCLMSLCVNCLVMTCGVLWAFMFVIVFGVCSLFAIYFVMLCGMCMFCVMFGYVCCVLLLIEYV